MRSLSELKRWTNVIDIKTDGKTLEQIEHDLVRN